MIVRRTFAAVFLLGILAAAGVWYARGRAPARSPGGAEPAAGHPTDGARHRAIPDPPDGLPVVDEPYVPVPEGRLSFNESMASLFHAKCGACHREGGSGPFSLLHYDEVAGRAEQILQVTDSRYMPPWHPVPGHGAFDAPRHLTVQEIGMIAQWVGEGCREGPPPAPPPPQWTAGWKLGEPDLILEMDEPYELKADGTDVFRNFVVPIPIEDRRYVVGFEFRASAPQVVHHARMFLDETDASRQRDEQDPEPGFDYLGQGAAEDPPGHWLGWTPGKQPARLPPGIGWVMEPDTDLVLELHMMPSGKPERVHVSMGLYFSEQAPRQIPQVIRLGPRFLNIPPGEPRHVVRDSYRLPVPVLLRSVYAHAHYLGQQVLGYAVLPDGRKQWLLRIDEWDFNWQDEYRYVQPVFLPAGTQVVMQFSYDNSAENYRNPHVPPKRVFYGIESRSEMAELWLQVIPADARDRTTLAQDYVHRERRMLIDGYRREIETRPQLSEPRFRLAELLAGEQLLGEAEQLYRSGLERDPDHAVAQNNFGVLLAQQQRFAEAHRHFRRAVALDPAYYDARVNLDKCEALLGTND